MANAAKQMIKNETGVRLAVQTLGRRQTAVRFTG
jgi:hypothetical protein